MGLQIGYIVPRHEVAFSDLKGNIIAVDAFYAIYQFLSSKAGRWNAFNGF